MTPISDNPWIKLRTEAPYALGEDLEPIERFNRHEGRRPEHRIELGTVPEPFIGDPRSARLVMLSLNPRHGKKNFEEHSRPQIKAALFRNLHHEIQDYPFYPLNPEFDGTGVAEYWRPLLKHLIRETGLDDRTMSQRILAIEWFPYHSETCGLRRQLCKSQDYSFCLAMSMLKRSNVKVLGLRSQRYWNSVNEAFYGVPYVTNHRKPYVSRRNMDPGLFDEIVRLLKQD